MNQDYLETRDSNTKEELTFQDGLYYKDDDTVPFCPNCYDNSSKLIHLKKNTMPGFEEHGSFDCPNCRNFF